MAEVSNKPETHSDDELSSSDSEIDAGPPPMIQIERSSDVGALKSAFLAMKDKQPETKDKEVDEGLGKENLSNITTVFEKMIERPMAAKQEREKLTLVDKEQYSSFKNKFENINEEMAKKDEERRTMVAKDIQGVGKSELAQAKTVFETAPEAASANADKKIEVERSEADKKRVKETFFEASDKEESRECAVCGKMVYPVEKVQLEKRVFHKTCFKCHTCQKTLSVQGYTMHDGKLFCKLHIMEIYRPEIGLAHEGALEGGVAEPDEEEDYALVTKPKTLDPSVVRSGLKSTDDLDNVPKLQNVKAKWTESAEQSSKLEKRTEVEADLIQQGKVKSRLSKFVEGGDNDPRTEEEDDDDVNRDPNIARGSKKKEAIQVEVGAKSMKGKWETGTIESAQTETQDRSSELEELKKNISVKERFKERTGDETDAAAAQRRSVLDAEQLDLSSTKTAKERFQKGEAFQETTGDRTSKEDIHFADLGNVKKRFETGEVLEEHVAEKTAVDVKCGELGNLKAAFEQTGKSEEESPAKRQQITDEFERIKQEKELMREKERQEAEEEAKNQGLPSPNPEDVRQSADLSSIKKRFEEGTAFQGDDQQQRRSDEQLEIKVAAKARQKFKQIDQDAPKEPVINQGSAKQEPSKWAKEKIAAPEPINRRAAQDDDEDHEEDFQVKNILSKFKTIEQTGDKPEEVKGPKPKRQITPPPEGYRAEVESAGKERDPNVVASAAAEELAAIKVEARNLMEKFEKAGQETAEDQQSAEKRKQLEEEFQKIKEMKETQKQAEPEEPDADSPDEGDPDLAVAAEHAQKARAKWDKIQKKEAKKVQKQQQQAGLRRTGPPAKENS